MSDTQSNQDLPPAPSPPQEEQRAIDQTARSDKFITGCGFAGAALFFLLNKMTEVIPGGLIGGAIGGGLGALVGIWLQSLRRK